MKKILALLMSLTLCFGMVSFVNAAPMSDFKEVIVESEEDSAPTRGVSVSDSFYLQVGKSYNHTFMMNNLFAEDHNAFKVVINNVSGGGTYKVITRSSGGFSDTSTEKSGGYSFSIINAKPNVSYTVTIVNTSAVKISGDVKISSYYNK